MDTDKLFPEVPEDLTAVDSSDLLALEKDIRAGIALVEASDEEFLAGREGAEVTEALLYAVDSLEKIVAEFDGRAESAEKAAEDEKAKQAEAIEKAKGIKSLAEAEEVKAEDEPAPDDPSEPAPDEEDGAVVEEQKELEPVMADAEQKNPAPASDRMVVTETPHQEIALLAAGGLSKVQPGTPFDRMGLAETIIHESRKIATPPLGVKYSKPIASAEFVFPEERTLSGTDLDGNAEKIRAVVPVKTGWGEFNEALTASGNVLCAPLTPFYGMPNYASEARPVRDALPAFRADRGGVNVPRATTIGDITTAISVIDQSDESAGGTFNTKTCQDMTCPTYDETFITTIAHCREYGNLNARAWPEKIAHENALTMAAHARSAEGYLLDQIKAASVNVTNGATTLGSLIYMVDAIVRARFGIIGRLRMDPETVFRALLPNWVPDMLALDNASTQYYRFTESEEALVAYLESFDIAASFYMDTPSTGNSQLPDSSQTAAAIDALPATVQWALFPEGGFLFLDGGSLELGIVRDSTLNVTNNFEVFGETFENVARIAPAQAAYWVTTTYCASGEFPPLGTARTCP